MNKGELGINKSLKLKLMTAPPPPIVTVKLEVLEDLQIGNVIYTQGHTVEVTQQEARALLEEYEPYFDVVE